MERKRIIPGVLILLVVFGFVFIPVIKELKKLEHKNKQLLKRIELLEDHNVKLEKELNRMEKDPEYLERRAMEKLGVVKKGEIIYRINSDEES